MNSTGGAGAQFLDDVGVADMLDVFRQRAVEGRVEDWRGEDDAGVLVVRELRHEDVHEAGVVVSVAVRQHDVE
jgi:hypothetical protein